MSCDGHNGENGGAGMKQDEYWNRFVESGSVQDYLGFCDVRSREQGTVRDRRMTEYAGFCDSHGDGAEDDSRGGV